jgi:hypothetical protein
MHFLQQNQYESEFTHFGYFTVLPDQSTNLNINEAIFIYFEMMSQSSIDLDLASFKFMDIGKANPTPVLIYGL